MRARRVDCRAQHGRVADAGRAAPSRHWSACRRVVTLGTPHRGTLAAVQALRATYPTVRRLAALDPAAQRGATDGTRVPQLPRASTTCCPMAGALTDLDLFDAAPVAGARAAARRRGTARSRRACCAGRRSPTCACIAIAGTGQRTATRLRRIDDDFEYEITLGRRWHRGDGVGHVARRDATGSMVCEHSGLPRSEQRRAGHRGTAA